MTGVPFPLANLSMFFELCADSTLSAYVRDDPMSIADLHDCSDGSVAYLHVQNETVGFLLDCPVFIRKKGNRSWSLRNGGPFEITFTPDPNRTQDDPCYSEGEDGGAEFRLYRARVRE
jgi:hypothetical protein